MNTQGNLKRKYQIALRRYLFTKSDCGWEYFGCSKEAFIEWVELHFSSEMSWGNYGQWELDHILPVALFDLNNEFDRKMALNFINVRPMWKSQNKLKSINPNSAVDYFKAILEHYDNEIVRFLHRKAVGESVIIEAPIKALEWLQGEKAA